ncbi:hypothetical protein HDU67_006840 [Dinochytrium kinnereticum]|nr:hypothetical protein HDU67_006840 [Dinochytrium kinnereticum]
MEIAETRDNIEELKVRLEEEQRLKKNRIEYDEIAKKINELPSRQESITNSERLKSDIQTLTHQADLIRASKSHRRTLFRSVLMSLQNLKDLISDDSSDTDMLLSSLSNASAIPETPPEISNGGIGGGGVRVGGGGGGGEDVVWVAAGAGGANGGEEEEEGAFVGDEGKDAMDVS